MEHMRVKDDGTNSFLAGFATSVVLGANSNIFIWYKSWRGNNCFGQVLEVGLWCMDSIKSLNGLDFDCFLFLFNISQIFYSNLTTL